jgi:pimeloyl-ACP methyl ester carboxylesterase
VGEPGLSARSRPPLASEAYAFWLDDVLRALAVPRVSIVGVSLGGWLALDYAIRRPGSVDRLALLCPGGIGRQKWVVLVAALLLMPFGRWGLRTTMRLAAGGALPVTTPHAREFADYLMLIHRHFRPQRERLPIFDDDAWAACTCRCWRSSEAGIACSTPLAPAGGWNGRCRTRLSGCSRTPATSCSESPEWSSTSS